MEGEDPSANQNFGRGRSAERAFTPVLILVIALPEEKDNSQRGSGGSKGQLSEEHSTEEPICTTAPFVASVYLPAFETTMPRRESFCSLKGSFVQHRSAFKKIHPTLLD